MKRIYILFIVAVLSAACVKTTQEDAGYMSELLFSASTSDCLVDSKASFDRTGKDLSVTWRAGDMVAITDGVNMASFQALEDGLVSSFQMVSGQNLAEGSSVEYTAFYPAAYLDGNDYVLPAEQVFRPHGIEVFPMVARSSSTNLAFKSVCSLLEIRIYTNVAYAGAMIDKVVLESAAGESLCGIAAYNFDTDQVSVAGSGKLTLLCPDPVQIGTTPTSFFFAIPAGTYASGMKLTVFTHEGSSQTITTTAPMTVKRSYLYGTAVACEEIVWDYSYGTANSVNAYGLTEVEIDITPYAVGADCMRLREALKAPVPVAATLVWNNDGAIVSGTPVVENGMLKVCLNPSSHGNALVAITDEDSEILWSYHIWKPLENPENTIYYPVPKVEMMRMNLGAGKAFSGEYDADVVGLFYQWGRKDPFQRTGTVSRLLEADVYNMIAGETNRQSHVAVDYATKHPNVYLANAMATAYDWASTVAEYRNDNLWGDPLGYQSPSGQKSVYDPCPDGYHVANYGFAASFGFDQENVIYDADGKTFRGISFEVSAGVWDYYVSQGYRSRANGGISGTNQAFYWMGAPYPSSNNAAGGFNFTSTAVTPLSGRVKAYGFPVRCCK